MAARPSFRFDPNRCTGCDACELACTIENGLELGSAWRRVLHFNPRGHPAAPSFHLSLACNHCAEPACLRACPVRAFRVDRTTGAVLLEETRCIGCRYCTWACPYGALRFDPARGVIAKCSFCIERLHAGGTPACASLCPTGALGFGTLPEEEIEQELEGFPWRPERPALRILPLRPARSTAAGLAMAGLPRGPHESPTVAEAAPPAPVEMPPAPGVPHPSLDELPPPLECEVALPASPIHPWHEWSLVLFTLLSSLLVAIVTARVLGAAGFVHPLPPADRLGPLAFLGAALAALGLGGAHLGRKRRAWRALANVKSSWLAREIAAFLLFIAAATAWLARSAPSRWEGLLVAALGGGLLVAIDRVYSVCLVPNRAARPHSGGALLTGVFLAAVLAAEPIVAVAAGAAKTALYLRRRLAARERWHEPLPLPFGSWVWAVARLGCGFVLPGAAAWVAGREAWPLVLAGTLAGEWLDRSEYYAGLGLESPEREMVLALRARLEAAGAVVSPGGPGAGQPSPGAGLRPAGSSPNL